MSNNIQRTIRSLFKSGQHNIVKIASLSIGLTVGILLLAKVYFEESYDQFYPQVDQIYQVNQVIIKDGEYKEYSKVAGGIVVRLKEGIPSIEAATRFTYLTGANAIFTDQEHNRIQGTIILADSCFFDLFPRPMILGNAKDILSRPMHAIISRTLAEKMGGDVIGRTISAIERPDPEQRITISGIFEDLPENSSEKYDIIVSLSSIGNFLWDGSMNLVGNDRYKGFIKLTRGTHTDKLSSEVKKVVNRHVPVERLEQAGLKFSLKCIPYAAIHAEKDSTVQSNRFLMLLAFALIFTAILNYILIVISVLVNRSKEIAVYKCYGAGQKDIFRLALAESFIHFFLAILLGVVLVFLFQDSIYQLLNASISALFLSKGTLLLMALCGVVFLFVAITSAYIYQQIPIASAFRNYKENKRYWKLVLLFFQFISVGFLLSLLVVINRQYKLMVNDQPGYNYDHVGHVSVGGLDSIGKTKIFEELKRLPQVESIASCSQLPFNQPSGNNVFIPGEEKDLFNVADLYFIDNAFFDLLQIPIVEGRKFTPTSTESREIMIDRRFSDKMKQLNRWKDGAIGQSICITEHGSKPYTVCGIYENIRLNSIANQDARPSVLFSNNNRDSQYILIKLKNSHANTIQIVEEKLNKLIPNQFFQLSMWKDRLRDLYTEPLRFRNAVMIGSIITLLISLIGLMGYTQDELNRRQKEIAIRKVNGGSLRKIFQLFLKDILKIALPAISMGALLAFFASKYWLEQFSEKIELNVLLFIGCSLVALVVIILVMAQHFARVANANPMKALKCN